MSLKVVAWEPPPILPLRCEVPERSELEPLLKKLGNLFPDFFVVDSGYFGGSFEAEFILSFGVVSACLLLEDCRDMLEGR